MINLPNIRNNIINIAIAQSAESKLYIGSAKAISEALASSSMLITATFSPGFASVHDSIWRVLKLTTTLMGIRLTGSAMRTVTIFGITPGGGSCQKSSVGKSQGFVHFNNLNAFELPVG